MIRKLLLLALAALLMTMGLARADNSDQPVVLVAGATGRTGKQVVEQLRRDGRYRLRPMARDPAAARHATGDYGWVRGDVTQPATLTMAMSGVTYVISAIGATERSGPNSAEFVDYRGLKNLTDAARSAGVKQIVIITSSAVGTDGFLHWFVNLVSGDGLVWKEKAENSLRASGLPYTIIRPGGLRDDDGGKQGLRLHQAPESGGRIARADLASVMIAAVNNPAALNKTFIAIGDDDRAPDAWRGEFATLKRD